MNSSDVKVISLTEDDIERFITDLYRIFLKRKPDQSGLTAKKRRFYTSGEKLQDIVESFTISAEAKNVAFTELWNKRKTIYQLDTSEDITIVKELFSKSARYWRNAGLDEKEIYFSVVSSPNYKKQLTESDLRIFYATGKKFIDFCIDRLAEHNVTDLSSKSCLDFGCGVGRLSFNASSYFEKIYAVDFSQGHLSLFQENIRKLPDLHKNNMKLIYLDQFEDLNDKLPENMDFVYSYITLQHNTPSVMAFIVGKLLETLRPEGLACLHIPVHHPFYNFSEQNYLASEKAGTGMEMHILPRENIREIALKNNSKIVDSFGFGGTQGIYSEVFLFKKQSC